MQQSIKNSNTAFSLFAFSSLFSILVAMLSATAKCAITYYNSPQLNYHYYSENYFDYHMGVPGATDDGLPPGLVPPELEPEPPASPKPPPPAATAYACKSILFNGIPDSIVINNIKIAIKNHLFLIICFLFMYKFLI